MGFDVVVFGFVILNDRYTVREKKEKRKRPPQGRYTT
jgi:hypothetical protein